MAETRVDIHGVDIHITAPFALDRIEAELTYDGGTAIVTLERGRYTGALPGRPKRLRLIEEPPRDAGLAPAEEAGEPDEGDQPGGAPVEADVLFGSGIEVPAGGHLCVQIVWATPCHQAVETPEGRRFGSYEHQLCADRVGLDEQDPLKPLELTPLLEVGGLVMPVNKTTELTVGVHKLRFGDIIALAGDFYAHLDDAAADAFSWAWPKLAGFAGWLSGKDYRRPALVGADAGEPKDILSIVERDKDSKHGVAGEFCLLVADSVSGNYPARRYLALASQNFCHFGSQHPFGRLNDERNTALRLYREYHKRALAEARAAGDDQDALLRAFGTDAFGCHFLTDLFASGHMRVPRRELGDKYGILIGALRKAHAMHAEDNQHGLWCAARGTVDADRRLVWRAYGDGMLLTDEAGTHLDQVREAVRRSAAEVFKASRSVGVMEEEKAEWLIPVPLRAGEAPRAADDVRGDFDQSVRNHYPLYWLLSSGHVAKRVGDRNESAYRYKVAFDDIRDLEFGSVP